MLQDLVAEAEAELLDLPLMRTADLPDQVPELPDVSVRFLAADLSGGQGETIPMGSDMEIEDLPAGAA